MGGKLCQLGENIQSAEGLVEDYVEMLAFIEKRAPNAKRLVIGSFAYGKTGTIDVRIKIEQAKENYSKKVETCYNETTKEYHGFA